MRRSEAISQAANRPCASWRINRTFVVSPFLYLELVPKAIFNKRRFEKAFYDQYFQETQWSGNLRQIAALARAEAERAGLGAMDALHLAAAHLAGAIEFITTEKPTSSIFRSTLLPVRSLYR